MNTTSVTTAPIMAPRFDGRLLFESNNLDIVHLTLKTGDAIAPHSNPVDVVFFVVEGEGILTVEEETFNYKKGDCIPMKTGINRGWSNPNQADLKLLVIKMKGN